MTCHDMHWSQLSICSYCSQYLLENYKILNINRSDMLLLWTTARKCETPTRDLYNDATIFILPWNFILILISRTASSILNILRETVKLL